MEEKQVYRGTVKTGRGAGAGEMSAPGVLDGFRLLTGLAVIPGTLNVDLTEVLDLSLLNYNSLAELGMAQIDLCALGIDFDGEQGIHYGRILIGGRYPGCLICFTWVDHPGINVELVSPHHLRNTLNLQDGDTVEFTVV
jgi:CTP-dependent riboflavin kinase